MKQETVKCGPYKELFIYYLSGSIRGNEPSGDTSYIGAWEEGGVTFLFFTEPRDKMVERLCESAPGLAVAGRYEMPYEDWHGTEIKPFYAGGFFVVPPWLSGGKGEGRKIILDPGVVFGAGNHPTTRDCLEAISMVFANDSPASAVDLGTGTGILALAAAVSGCSRVIAVDLLMLSARTALENFRVNGLLDKILPVCGRAEDFVPVQADLLMANIPYEVMRYIVQAPGFDRKKWVVLSGLLRTGAKMIEERLSRMGARLVRRWCVEGTWHTFLYRFG